MQDDLQGRWMVSNTIVKGCCVRIKNDILENVLKILFKGLAAYLRQKNGQVFFMAVYFLKLEIHVEIFKYCKLSLK